jgi:hypothetical protein
MLRILLLVACLLFPALAAAESLQMLTELQGTWYNPEGVQVWNCERVALPAQPLPKSRMDHGRIDAA